MWGYYLKKKKERKKQKYPRKGKLKEEYESVARLWRRKKSEKLSIEGHASATYSARSLHHLFSPQWRSISSQLSPLFEKSILATPRQWADIYIHWFSLHRAVCTHTHTLFNKQIFFRIARIPSEILFLSWISNFIVCFDTRFRVATETMLLPCWRLREPILSERVSSSLRKYPILQLLLHSRFLLFVGFTVAIVSDRTEYRVTGTRRYGINRFSRFFFFFSFQNRIFILRKIVTVKNRSERFASDPGQPVDS